MAKSKPEQLKYSVKAIGRFGTETLRAKGTLDLADWIEPTEAAAIAAGVITGINDAVYKSGALNGASPFGGQPMSITIKLRYPAPRQVETDA